MTHPKMKMTILTLTTLTTISSLLRNGCIDVESVHSHFKLYTAAMWCISKN